MTFPYFTCSYFTPLHHKFGERKEETDTLKRVQRSRDTSSQKMDYFNFIIFVEET